MRVRVTTGAAGVKLHIVAQDRRPLESLCGRAYSEPDPQTLDLNDVLGDPMVCRSCARFFKASYHKAPASPGGGE